MTKYPSTKEIRSTKSDPGEGERASLSSFGHWGFVIPSGLGISSFVIVFRVLRHSSFPPFHVH
jgi:hypothetical protein